MRRRVLRNPTAHRAERLKRLILRDEDLLRNLSNDRRRERAQAARRIVRNRESLRGL